MATLEIKFGIYDRLPLLLLGIAHTDEVQAREIAAACLTTFDKDIADMDSNMHPLCLHMMRHGSGLRPELEAFAMGTESSDLPALQAQMYKLRTIGVVERSIEGKHALMKSKLLAASKPSSPLISFSLRCNEIRRHLEAPEGEQFFRELCTHFDESRSALQVVQTLGLQNSEAIILDFSRRGGRLSRKVVASFLYHRDEFSMFSGKDLARKQLNQRIQAENRRKAKTRAKRAAANSAHQGCAARLLWKAAQQHLRGNNTLLKPSRSVWVSLRLQGDQVMRRLEDCIKGGGWERPLVCDSGDITAVLDGSMDIGAAGSDVRGGDSTSTAMVPYTMSTGTSGDEFMQLARQSSSPGPDNDCFFLKVQSMSPSSLSSYSQYDMGAALGADDFLGTMHRCLSMDDDCAFAVLEFQPSLAAGSAKPLLVWSLPQNLSASHLRDCVQVWQSDVVHAKWGADIIDVFANCDVDQAIAESVAVDMLRTSAFEDTVDDPAARDVSKSFIVLLDDTERFRCMELLEQLAFVRRDSTFASSSSWTLLSAGLRHLVIVECVLRSEFPLRLPSHPDDRPDVMNLDKWQAMLMLQEKGFELVLVQPRQRTNKIPSYAAGGALQYYARDSESTTVSLRYMQALLLADEKERHETRMCMLCEWATQITYQLIHVDKHGAHACAHPITHFFHLSRGPLPIPKPGDWST